MLFNVSYGSGRDFPPLSSNFPPNILLTSAILLPTPKASCPLPYLATSKIMIQYEALLLLFLKSRSQDSEHSLVELIRLLFLIQCTLSVTPKYQHMHGSCLGMKLLRPSISCCVLVEINPQILSNSNIHRLLQRTCKRCWFWKIMCTLNSTFMQKWIRC